MIIYKRIRTWAALISTSGVLLCSSLIFSLPASASAITSTLSLSPSKQMVTNGSNVIIKLNLVTGGDSVNTVQTVLSYPSSNFSLVKATAGSSFTSFNDNPKNGSLSLIAASSKPVNATSPVTVATIVLKAKASASTNFKLATICPTGNYAMTCSAVYDATNNSNDLAKIVSPARATVRLSAKDVSSKSKLEDDSVYVFLLLVILFGLVLVRTRKQVS